MNLFQKFFFSLTKIFFPTYCLRCAREGELLCATCTQELHRPIYTPELIHVSSNYKHEAIKKAIWLLKYENNKEIVRILGDILSTDISVFLTKNTDTETFVIIPIPLHASRERQRGYNQSARVAEHVFKHLSTKENTPPITYAPHALTKHRKTAPQTTIKNKRERIKNIRNAFSVTDTASIRNKHIILIDDVTTTGSTLMEAQKTLLKAGARTVSLFAIAHTTEH